MKNEGVREMAVTLKITREYKLHKILYDFLEYQKVKSLEFNSNGRCFKCNDLFLNKEYTHLAFFENHQKALLCTRCADAIAKKNQVEIIRSMPRKV